MLAKILLASAQIGPEELQVCYGPDTYMGKNLISLMDAVISTEWRDEQIRADLHPSHNRSTIRALMDNINVYLSRNCIVHHMFGPPNVPRDYANANVPKLSHVATCWYMNLERARAF